VKVEEKDIEKYPIECLNPYLLNHDIEKKKFYNISRFKPNFSWLIMMIMVLCREKYVQIIQPEHIAMAYHIIKTHSSYHHD